MYKYFNTSKSMNWTYKGSSEVFNLWGWIKSSHYWFIWIRSNKVIFSLQLSDIDNGIKRITFTLKCREVKYKVIQNLYSKVKYKNVQYFFYHCSVTVCDFLKKMWKNIIFQRKREKIRIFHIKKKWFWVWIVFHHARLFPFQVKEHSSDWSHKMGVRKSFQSLCFWWSCCWPGRQQRGASWAR